MRSGRLDEMLKAAADPTRLRLLNLLRLGGICVCDLQAVLRHPATNRFTTPRRIEAWWIGHGCPERDAHDLRARFRRDQSLISRRFMSCWTVAARRMSKCAADIARFREAVAAGTCRLETAGSDAALPDEAQLQGNPA